MRTESSYLMAVGNQEAGSATIETLVRSSTPVKIEKAVPGNGDR
jgi:hypothetical protein